MTETVNGRGEPRGNQSAKGLKIQRVYTTAGVHPYDEVTWERRDVLQTNWRTGETVFEQRGVEFPDFWSVNASTIVTTKYFRGAVGTDAREWSLRQLIDRVVHKYRSAGDEYGYFTSSEDADIFEHELTWMLLHQVFSFNSPVWFNVGTRSPQQVSACQPYDALVSTPAGLVPIGELVRNNTVGEKVYDAHGITTVVAVKANGVKPVLRLHLKSGQALDVTADHLVYKSTGQRSGRFVEAGSLRPGDQLEWHRRESFGDREITTAAIAEAALAGWLQSDRFVGQYSGTNKSLTIEAMTVNEAELRWVTDALENVFPHIHRKERFVTTQDQSLDCRRTRLHGNDLHLFVERWGLTEGGRSVRVPPQLFNAPLPVVAAYLRSLFQAEGYVSERDSSTLVGLDMVSEELVRGMQALLARFGIFARVSFKRDDRAGRQGGIWSLRIENAGDRRLFADEIGFIDPRNTEKLERSLDLPGIPAYDVKLLEIARIEDRGPQEVFDIQTESGEYLSQQLRVHNCFILSVDDSMDSILNWYREEGLIFKGGSGAGVNLSRIRSSKELLSSGGTASGPVSFMRGADASAGTIKSGGATRRAAKMVVLDVDHPDVAEFIETKAREEEKIRVLRDAGFDMDLGGRDVVSVQYQNANNSVRVSDEFMRAVEAGETFGLRARRTGEVIDRVNANELFRSMAQAAWECADPGIQYDDTINDWHTNPETGRITASNPCFTGNTLVALADGTSVRFDELVGRDVDVIAKSPTGETLTRRMSNIRLTRRNASLVQIRLDDGGEVRCTPDHLFMLSSGSYRAAEDLRRGDSLMRYDAHDRLPAAVNHKVVSVQSAGVGDVYDGVVDELHNFAIVTSDGSGIFVHNCSEYMSLDNSSCNLASLNLMKFVKDDGGFDAGTFVKVVELVITAMDISISFADFPTQAIRETTRAYRQLGIGYANLGALLMASGLAYDSDGGRALAAAITSLMTGAAYKRSAELAAVVGSYDGFARNATAHARVMRKHQAANDELHPIHPMDGDVLALATKVWAEGNKLGERVGWRNAQASLLAPTGTIAFMLDCDTTGIEPDFSLVKFKKLVGGGSLQIVNQTVPRALRKLGYADETIEAIVEYISEHGHVVDAPGLRPEHYEVFDCAAGQPRSIEPMGHVRMMAAVQKFLSGAISKTVNMPESATVEDIEEIYLQGWKLGLKALAVYRDNCKVGQPLSDAKAKGAAKTEKEVVVEYRPTRRRLPKKRPSQTISFAVGGAEGYMTAGSYPDNGLGELFLKMSKQGSTLAGMMDAFSIAVSIGLQYGVPLETYVSKFTNMRFEPAGMTDDPDVRMAQSVVDYIFRRLALDYLPFEDRAALGIYTAKERARQLETGVYQPEEEVDVETLRQSAPVEEKAPAATTDASIERASAKEPPRQAHTTTELVEELQGTATDAPLCFTCGTKMRPAGSCYVCEGCGATSGCS